MMCPIRNNINERTWNEVMGPDVIFSEFTARLPAGLLKTSQQKVRLGSKLAFASRFGSRAGT